MPFCFRNVSAPRGCGLAATLFSILALAACSPAVDLEAEADELRRLHEVVLAAHRSGNVGSWMAVEADTVVSANRGEITFPQADDRRTMRELYLGSTSFTVYEDLRPPVVRVSDDGTLGWLIAEVETRGTQMSGDGEVPVEAVWAWIELYEKGGDGWKLVGNVSNRRP